MSTTPTGVRPLIRNVADFLESPMARMARAVAEAGLARATAVTFAADVAQYQPPLSGVYADRVVIFRVGEGDYRKDAKFDANYAEAKRQVAAGELDCFGVYHVGLAAGVNGVRSVQSQLDAIHGWLGGALHPAGFFMEDAENWSGLQGGDLSATFNALIEGAVAHLLGGNEARTLGYANGSDWGGLWRSRPSWLKRTVASWGTVWPGTFGWQYRGGTNTPAARGYPTTCAPFGACDLNAFVGRTASEVAAAFGIGDDMPLDANDPVVKAIRGDIATLKADLDNLGNIIVHGDSTHPDSLDALQRGLALIVHGGDGYPNSEDAISAHVTGLQTLLTGMQAQITKLSTSPVDVATLTSQLLAGGLPAAIAAPLAQHLTLTAK